MEISKVKALETLKRKKEKNTNLHAVVRMKLTVRVMSNAIVEGHQKRIDVFEAFELRLVNLLDDAVVVWREVHGFVCELGWKVGQVTIVF